MLPTNFNDRLNQMMGVKLEEIARETQETFSKDSADAAGRGHLNSSYTLGLHQKKRLQQINIRVEAVLDCQKRLISALHLPFTDTLASELKEQAHAWVPEEWCEQSIQSDPNLGLMKDYKPAVSRRNYECQKQCPQESVCRNRSNC